MPQCPLRDLPLSFSRVYGESIISRYKLGPLGRGWTDNWDVRAEVQSNGDVVLRGPAASIASSRSSPTAVTRPRPATWVNSHSPAELTA